MELRTPSELVQNKSVAMVLNALHFESQISRIGVARKTGMSPSTVSAIMERLVEEEVVYPVGSVPSATGAGRRPVLYEIDANAFYLVGIDIQVERAVVVLIDCRGGVQGSDSIKVDTAADPPDATLTSIIEVTERLIVCSGIERAKLIGIGISFLGLIDRDKGVAVYSSTLPQWQGVQCVRLVESSLRVPTFLENDANAMVLGEVRFGVAQGKNHVFGVWVGRGLGGGIVLNKELIGGHLSTAGELGHIIIHPNGPLCTCGNRGCLKALASENAIEANAQRMMRSDAAPGLRKRTRRFGRDITVQDVIEEAESGCETCTQVLYDAADAIGLGLVTVVNLLSPEMIVLNRSILTSYTPFLDRIRRSVEDHIYSRKMACPEIVLGTLGENALAIGAATLALDSFLIHASSGS